MNRSQESNLLTSKTRIVSHNDFLKNFSQNIFGKFEVNLVTDLSLLRASPRLFFIDEHEYNTFLKEVTTISEFSVNRQTYENIEEIVKSIYQRKSQDKAISIHKRKLFFLNSLVKYMKIAMRFCLGKSYHLV